MIIAGGEPELCCRRHAKQEGGVYGRPMHYVCVKSCPECSVHMLYLWLVGKCEKGLVWSNQVRKTDVRETQGCMVIPTRKRKYEEVHWSLSRSSLAVHCMGVSAFHFPIVGVLSLVAISTTHCTVHMLVAWRRRVVAWTRATYQYHVTILQHHWSAPERPPTLAGLHCKDVCVCQFACGHILLILNYEFKSFTQLWMSLCTW